MPSWHREHVRDILFLLDAGSWVMDRHLRTSGQVTTVGGKRGEESWCPWKWSLSGISSVDRSALPV